MRQEHYYAYSLTIHAVFVIQMLIQQLVNRNGLELFSLLKGIADKSCFVSCLGVVLDVFIWCEGRGEFQSRIAAYPEFRSYFGAHRAVNDRKVYLAFELLCSQIPVMLHVLAMATPGGEEENEPKVVGIEDVTFEIGVI